MYTNRRYFDEIKHDFLVIIIRLNILEYDIHCQYWKFIVYVMYMLD